MVHLLEDPCGEKSFSARWALIPQRCPFCSFLHAFLGPPLHCSPKLSLPQRHRKPCIVCPATKGNAKTPEWPSLTRTPKPRGNLGFSDCQRTSPSEVPGPRNIALFVFEEGVLGGHRPCIAWFGGESGGATTVETCRSPGARADGRDCSAPCVTVAERLPLYVSPGHGVGAGRGQMEGAPRFISKVLHLCDGVGW